MNNKKTIIALLLIAIIGIVGLTIAYFANSTDVENTFTTKEYGSTYTESFVSPDNWLPGDTTPKTLVATNTGEVDQAVRVLVTESWTTNNNGTLNGWIHSDGTKSTHTTQSELETDERVAILNLANTSDWTKVRNYYYYNYKLAPTESTTSLLESVTFNPKTKLDDTCTTTTNNGVTTTTCNSSGDDYDNATYTLTLTIETVQYNKYATAWSTGNTVNILEERPAPQTAAQYLISNATNASDAQYGVTTKSNMFVFNHETTEQTTALTDYRYIGDEPNNYVKFNCDNDGTNCETWRILGVFSVDDGTSNYEQRIKLVRGSAFDGIAWNEDHFNDWINASLKVFLNGDYYNRSGVASTYGLKVSAKSMIDNAVFYLGGSSIYLDGDDWTFGTSEEIYVWERGTETCVTTGYCSDETRSTQWIGKVGIMYPSDGYMVYGKGVNTKCYNNPLNCSMDYDDEDYHPTTGWIYNSNIYEGADIPNPTWLLSPYSEVDFNAFIVNANGILDNSDNHVGDNNAVRPVVYLSSSVKISDGDGTSGNPYKLSL